MDLCHKRFSTPVMKINKSLPLPGIAVIFTFILLTTLFLSCQKNSVSNNPKTSPDTTKSVTGLDTGSNTIGATMVAAMYTGTIATISFKPTVPVILNNKHDMVINGIATSSITLYNCSNIIIKNCKIGPNTQFGINITQCTNIKVDSCYIYMVSTGVYAGDSQTISVTNCQAKNMMGPFPDGQFVQYKNVSGGGNRVSFNKFENILGESYTEDAISMYKSNGLPTDPIVIESNWIKGGGPSSSGGGIMLGDGGGTYMIAKNNFLVDAGQYGMAVSGGSYMSIINNTIYGKSQPFTSEGIYYLNYTALPSTNIVITKNAINFTNSKNVLNDTYLGPGQTAPIGWANNVYSASLNATILPESIVSGSIFLSQ